MLLLTNIGIMAAPVVRSFTKHCCDITLDIGCDRYQHNSSTYEPNHCVLGIEIEFEKHLTLLKVLGIYSLEPNKMNSNR